jgi:putative DNA primase/helicase
MTVTNIKEHKAAAVSVYPPGQPMPNARLFLGAEYSHRERCLLLHQGGQFYRWDGTCWPALEDPILRAQLYRWFETKKYPEGLALKPFAPTVRKVADLMDAARAITIIATTTPTPSWLGTANHPAEQFISAKNGLIHWPTRTLHPHRPDFYVHHAVQFDFDPNAPEPERWLTFLQQLWPDDAETIEALQEMFGYLVSGETSQQKIFMLVGPKRAGKGTIARVLEQMAARPEIKIRRLGTDSADRHCVYVGLTLKPLPQ